MERTSLTGTAIGDPEPLRRWRADTPGCEDLVHLDNAGASPSPTPVLEAVIGHLRTEVSEGGYAAETEAAALIESVYDSVGALIGAAPSEIALVENATRAWDMAFYAIPFEPGDRIVTGVAEYASNYLAYLQLRRQRGVEIVVVPDDAAGELDVAALARLVDRRTRLISISHIPTNGGLVNPAAAVGRVARERGVLFLLDACQSVGQVRVDVDEIGCDLLTATGRKFLRGPRGTGFLYARAATTAGLHPPFVDLHAATWTGTDHYELRPDARRFENWESYVAGRIGLGVAVEYARSVGIDLIEARVRALAGRLRAGLAELAGVTVHDKGRAPGAIVTFSHDRVDARRLHRELRRRRMNTTVSAATSTRLDFEARGLPEMIRASVHYFNTGDELDRFVAAVADLT